MGKPPARSRITRERERDVKTIAFAEAKDGKKPKKGAAPDKATPIEGEPATDETETNVETHAETNAETPAETLAETNAETHAETNAKSSEPAATESPAPTPKEDATTMPMEILVGGPPELPAAPPSAVVISGAVEDPTHMPHPRDVPVGSPDDAAPPPGRVPPGDSRSLRNAAQFALIYRIGTFVITREGAVGKRGQWRVVEYPTSAAASHAYAKGSSRFVSEGFSDYRD